MPALLQQQIMLGIELNSYKCDNVFAATVAQASWPVVAAKRLFEPPTGCRTYEMTCRVKLAADAFAQQAGRPGRCRCVMISSSIQAGFPY